ncbi:hypothetical protein CJP74_07855 [Psittacicella melopsittaci]|uniref:Uncharacterized protein n=2 Tax=Psittacicella melopsittaci TaxID=2028576 RepID=A0A3A1Y1W8_9GAMM|nr:hypothetical protein CJP74_07855 [Psittacicella melopsittaci]
MSRGFSHVKIVCNQNYNLIIMLYQDAHCHYSILVSQLIRNNKNTEFKPNTLALLICFILARYFKLQQINIIHNVNTHVVKQDLVKGLKMQENKQGLIAYTGVHPMVISRPHIFAEYFGNEGTLEPYITQDEYTLYQKLSSQFFNELPSAKVLYLGEVGLDAGYKEIDLNAQIELLNRQLEELLSYCHQEKIYNVYLNNHAVGETGVDALVKTYAEFLSKDSNLKGIEINFHAFKYPEHKLKGFAQQLNQLLALAQSRAIELKIYLGIGYWATTSKKGKTLVSKIKKLNGVTLVSETDIPFAYREFVLHLSNFINSLLDKLVTALNIAEISFLNGLEERQLFNTNALLQTKAFSFITNYLTLDLIMQNNLQYPVVQINQFLQEEK